MKLTEKERQRRVLELDRLDPPSPDDRGYILRQERRAWDRKRAWDRRRIAVKLVTLALCILWACLWIALWPLLYEYIGAAQ